MISRHGPVPLASALAMAPLKQKGDLAEMLVAADLVRRGYKVALPYGEDWDYDLIVERGDRLERVQVKYTESNGAVICVRARTHSLTNGRVIAVKRYTAALIDWLAVHDRTSDRCYYIHASASAFASRPITSSWKYPLPEPRGRGANGNTPSLQGGVGGSIPPASIGT